MDKSLKLNIGSPDPMNPSNPHISGPQTHRPVSSGVSMKSDRSMGIPPLFSNVPAKSMAKPQTHRPVSPMPSGVSMKSDWSMGDPPLFSGNPLPLAKQQTHRPVSPVPSGVSMKSDWSMGDPPLFSNGPAKPVSPVPSNVSMKSDWSMGDPPLFSSGLPEPDPKFMKNSLTQDQSMCGMCEQLLRDPVIISCGHSFCGQCISQSGPSGDSSCLLCRKRPRRQVSEGSKDLLTEHNPVKRSKRKDGDVLKKVLATHKASMKRRFESISEGLLSGTQTLLNKIYTELYITEGESEGVNKEHEVWQVESASGPQTTEDIAIKYNDIFKHLLGEDKHIRTVMTKGIAGIGKTVSVQKFILDWAEERANQDVDFMFVLPFRTLNLVKNDEYSFHNLLLEFHPELKELQDGEYTDCHIVFIFDGLDESRLSLNFQENQMLSDVSQTSSLDVLMTSLIQGALLPSALIWITSRPAATSQIPSKCISLVTEVRGFSDRQKEEYFRKRIDDQNQANRIISHIKASKSLFIMCHMPVYCWISATVVQQLLAQDDGKKAPKTLTEMYIHFLLIQTTRMNQKYQDQWETHKGVILKLAELAFKNLENGNLMFYEEDLRECCINVSEASVYTGMCTEIFREECVFHQKKAFCFVHLSIQEFLAALHLFASYLNENKEVLKPFLSKKSNSWNGFSIDEILKNAVNKALESKNGHLDLFVRFLHGIFRVSNQVLLQGFLTRVKSSIPSWNNAIKNLKSMQRKNISPERCINLFHCLVEMHDSSVHDEIQAFLKTEKGSRKQLSLVQCSALAHMLLMSDKVLDEFDPNKYNTSQEGRRRLIPVVRGCRKALLADCKLTEKCLKSVTLALQSPNSPLRELDLSGNDLQKTEESLISALLNPACSLESLKLVDCRLSEKSSEIMVSSLLCTIPPLRELDLRYNNLHNSGKNLPAAPHRLNNKLEILRLAGCKLTKDSCEIVASLLQSTDPLLRELDLSHNNLPKEKLLSALQRHCKLETLRLADCNITEESCGAVASLLQSLVSLTELDLSHNDLKDSGVQLLSAGLRSPTCKLQTLRLSDCLITHKGFSSLASALKSNPYYLKELDLIYNNPGDSGVRELTDRLKDPNCRLDTFRYNIGGNDVIIPGLRKYAHELTLDPNTAHRLLSLSEGNRKMTCAKRYNSYPDHPDRFYNYYHVLCREGLSGRCYWEAEWCSKHVQVAVAYKSFQMGDNDSFGQDAKSWELEFYRSSCYARHNKRETVINAPSSSFSRVGVYLDWPAGTLSFYSVSSDTLTHLHTFHSTFTEPLYPGFAVWSGSLSLCQIT